MSRPGRWFARFAPYLSLVPVGAWLITLLAGDDAFARAGGGEHYSGGRSSGGGGGGFSGGGGGGGGGGDALFLVELGFRLVYWAVRLTISYPQFMIPVWIVVFLVWRYFSNQLPGAQTQGAMLDLDRSRLRKQGDLDARLAALQRKDAAFDREAFLARSTKVFLDVQEAWFLRDLAKARNFMSDGLHRRFQTLLALMLDENRRDAISDVKVLRMQMLAVTQSAAFDAITVRIDASLRDTEVPAGTSDDEARRLAKHSSPQEFTELWTFVRRLGVATNPEHDFVGKGQCPNCGAPFMGNQSGACEYCQAIVNSGSYDWVLSEITQASEFLPHPATVGGFKALREADPALSLEVLEDRSLLLFWKWLEARSFGRPAVLRKVASPELVARESTEIDDAKQRNRSLKLRLPSVGGADVVALESYRDGWDLAHVDVRWSAASRASTGSPSPRRHVVTMRRRHGAVTAEKTGLSGERCGHCAAPLTNTDTPTCDYCGTDLSAGQDDWTLHAVTPHEAWRNPVASAAPGVSFAASYAPTYAPTYSEAASPDAVDPDLGHEGLPALPSIATLHERLRLLRLLAAVAKADGVVTSDEKRLLRAYAQRWEVEWSMVSDLLRGNAADSEVDVGRIDPELVLQVLVDAAKIDGRIDRRERALILKTAAHLQVEDERAQQLMA